MPKLEELCECAHMMQRLRDKNRALTVSNLRLRHRNAGMASLLEMNDAESGLTKYAVGEQQ